MSDSDGEHEPEVVATKSEASPETQQLINLVQQKIQFMQATQDKLFKMSEENSLLRTQLSATNGDSREFTNASQTKKPDRPGISDDMSEGDWTVFLDAWNRYKVMCRLRNIDAIRNELRSACTPAVNKMLVELIGPTTLNGLSEDELLANIKRIAVHGVHKEVHRQRFTKISQHEGEPLNQFVARRKAQAEVVSSLLNHLL